MADRVILPRALDSNGDIVPAAEAYFYETGTTTPATVYSDSAGTVVVAQPLEADSAGNFAATFATEVLKVDIQTPAGVSLPGFPSDPHYQTQTNAGSAALISFTPTADIPQTNAQDAIEQVQTNLDDFPASPAFTGTPTAPTAAVGTDTTQIATTAFVKTQVLDEDDFATDSATRPASQQSTKAFIASENPVKAWVNFNGTGTVAIRESFNVSSITDNGTGYYTINFASAFADTNYGVVGTAERGVSTSFVALCLDNGTPKSTSSVDVRTISQSGDASLEFDSPDISVAIMR